MSESSGDPTGLNRSKCHLCDKLLVDEPGPEVTDWDGHRYHLQCWCLVMDVRIQEQREWLVQQRAKRAT